MSGLHAFRSRLRRLRFRRTFVRWQTAVCRVLVCTFIALVALLLIDFSLRLETAPRATVMLLAGCVLVWQVIRRIGPELFHHETVVDIALLLERNHRVDSDLVAALQFDSSANGSVGSLELQKAVIERAAKISETLDFRSAVPKDDARRAAWRAAIALLSVAVCWFAFPNHANAFWNRLWLGDAKYPTRTRIDEVTVNGRADEARVVEGETVAFHVQCSGVTPKEGIVRLQGMETGESTSVLLKRVNEKSDVAIYVADGPTLNEPIEYSIQIGDAETESRRIALIRRPLVELTIEAAAPAYMQHETIRQYEHYVQVMEGSSIELSLRCTNGKRLEQTRFKLIEADEQAGEVESIAFAPTDESGMAWRLDADASRLTRVVKELQFRVIVVDEDGLGTYHPIEGAVRVKPDRPPTATLSSSHHAILPNARPTIAYTADDDFGIGTMRLHLRRAGSREPDRASIQKQDGREQVEFSYEFDDHSSFDLPLPESTATTRSAAHRADHVLELSPFELVKGDKVLVWIEVTDYRGKWPGVSAISESIELEVTDERGVLDAVLRSDADAEQMLTDVIENELGLRGDR